MASKKRKSEALPEDALLSNGGPSVKKRKSVGAELMETIHTKFRHGLFDAEQLKGAQDLYRESRPYSHGVLSDLIDPNLLKSVRREIIENLSFTRKETDIYKIYQTGDLANLDGLDDDALKRLPSLLTLRNALYSPEFRSYLSAVTGAGPLSGKKTDMAINVYTPGCHLLCHDDVIGSRRISYILYLTDPDHPWIKEWGGSLRLYATKVHENLEATAKMRMPSVDPIFHIPPAWNQLSFFAVQPGKSFHDVEEVLAAKTEAHNRKRVRMAISGWYHIPQVGEEGYVEGLEETLAKESSLTQLQSKSNECDLPRAEPFAYPHTQKPVAPKTMLPTPANTQPSPTEAESSKSLGTELEPDEDTPTEAELTFLLKYISPTYLVPDTLSDLRDQFSTSYALRIDKFLNSDFAQSLRAFIDVQPDALSHVGLRAQRQQTDWQVARPPYKHRYMYLPHYAADPNNQNLLSVKKREVSPIKRLSSELLTSLAFRKWLRLATGLKLTSYDVRARRFRRGHDYSLATPYEKENPQLELTIGITPTKGWGDDDEEDEEEETEEKKDGDVVGKRSTKKKKEAPQKGAVSGKEKASKVKGGQQEHADNGEGESTQDVKTVQYEDNEEDNVGGYEMYMASDPPDTGAADPAVYQSAADEEDDVLFSMGAGWNRLSLVLRDEGSMRFVKYVSARAPGDRWDVVGEFDVEPEEDGDDEEELHKEDDKEDTEEEWNGIAGTETGGNGESEGTTDLAEELESELDSDSDL